MFHPDLNTTSSAPPAHESAPAPNTIRLPPLPAHLADHEFKTPKKHSPPPSSRDNSPASNHSSSRAPLPFMSLIPSRRTRQSPSPSTLQSAKDPKLTSSLIPVTPSQDDYIHEALSLLKPALGGDIPSSKLLTLVVTLLKESANAHSATAITEQNLHLLERRYQELEEKYEDATSILSVAEKRNILHNETDGKFATGRTKDKMVRESKQMNKEKAEWKKEKHQLMDEVAMLRDEMRKLVVWNQTAIQSLTRASEDAIKKAHLQ